ncbi:MAG: endonuclease III [Candidatus Marinimicrobia bacterium]|nr:endonuclease III [Candidatus Neomarinimicrobiota bacterium]MBT3502075.1 endonuclease III [Candidatus Neomarinimicrobiota bacterium]MBT3840482.1 endonuclease III [Candidatus Neomarinimicrobiota bacterium]MBT3999964.1 endonuclease III [Candidatus Neomarinimicrobiota bacterium]MBT4283499.1 endonuclease III [Candidatus Neomarinimicrobiota bacterium]
MRESKIKKRERAQEIIKRLWTIYPDSRCSLHYNTAHELLVATILSAQCTDHRVNIVTKDLFLKYKKPSDFAYSSLENLSRDIHSCGYHNQKAKSIQGSSLKIVEEHNEVVPNNINELVELPGVGRKTANCVLGEIYNIPSMVIDTHMVRIMGLLGFTKNKDAKKIELEIMEVFDKKDWTSLTHLIIDHGRAVCIARRPKCDECILVDLCPSTSL